MMVFNVIFFIFLFLIVGDIGGEFEILMLDCDEVVDIELGVCFREVDFIGGGVEIF